MWRSRGVFPVFSKDQIDAYVGLKWGEVYRFEQSPVEFDMYYSA
jgi:glutamine synthetase